MDGVMLLFLGLKGKMGDEINRSRAGRMDNEVESSSSSSISIAAAGKLGDSSSFVGKHRIAAAISQLEAHMNSMQEELDELESSGESSLVCKELMLKVESTPDPLLPWMTARSADDWDRWFRGAEKNSQRQRRRWVSSSNSK